MNDRLISTNRTGRSGCFCLALLITVGASAEAAAFPAGAQDRVRSLYVTLLATMKGSGWTTSCAAMAIAG
jgi:hypothetical protein